MSDQAARQPDEWRIPDPGLRLIDAADAIGGDVLELRAPDVFVTVGTDHHPFDRLITWIDAWSASRTDDVRCLIQYGTSIAPVVAQGTDYLPRQRLDTVMERSGTFVTHGGPATIAQCWELGAMPIVVPRNSSFGEHVDDHQMRFADRMAGEGRIQLASTQEELADFLDRRLAGETQEPPHRPEEVALAVATLGQQIDALVAAKKGRRRRFRLGGSS